LNGGIVKMERKDVGWRKADWSNLVPNRDKWRGIAETKEKRGLTWVAEIVSFSCSSVP